MAEVASEETNAKPTVEESNAEPSTGAEEEQRGKLCNWDLGIVNGRQN